MSLCGGGLAANAKTHAVGVGLKQLTMVAGADFHKYLPLSQADWVDQDSLTA
jgi:hypothetical protein